MSRFQVQSAARGRVCLVALLQLTSSIAAVVSAATVGVTYKTDSTTLTLDNGLFRVVTAKPEGYVVSIGYGPPSASSNVLYTANPRPSYFDLNWSPANNDSGPYDVILGTSYRLESNANDPTKVEISFKRPYKVGAVPLAIETHYLLRQGDSGLYVYHKLTHDKDWPDFQLQQLRTVWDLNPNYDYTFLADDRQRPMPSPVDIFSNCSESTDISEARILTSPLEPAFKGEVNDKYHYSADAKDLGVFGWTRNASSGFWMVSGSYEYIGGGPLKQDLTVQVDPLILKMLHSRHYGTPAVLLQGEDWSKIYGPYLVYINSGPSNAALWEDAKARASKETKAWPYPGLFADPAISSGRTRVSGSCQVVDKGDPRVSSAGGFVGLAAVSTPPNYWQDEVRGYQFWSKVEANGSFVLPSVRPGTYSLYVFVPGVLGSFQSSQPIIVTGSTSALDVGDFAFVAPRLGPTVWEIGVPDRTAGEFFIPKLNQLNREYPYTVSNPNRFRDYGAWAAYARQYPTRDLVYTVGSSNFSLDWFFVQPLRMLPDKTMAPTVWRIDFPLKTPATLQGSRAQDTVKAGGYLLRVAIAAAQQSALSVAVNDPGFLNPIFDSGVIGSDNALGRASDHGRYLELEIPIASSRLKAGVNSLFLQQRRAHFPFNHIMYDYLRLEGLIPGLQVGLPGSPPREPLAPAPSTPRVAPPLPGSPPRGLFAPVPGTPRGAVPLPGSPPRGLFAPAPSTPKMAPPLPSTRLGQPGQAISAAAENRAGSLWVLLLLTCLIAYHLR